ncbi:hypothetical protein [Dyadobacter diqingensis]|uniref:hypothetical protein n=1 Tax=Dyadobacter diqingensis TaxID=2938121 RepID=UPI0020C52E3A|nr:hypothetical protein [Dyadobacter diqingensis]
MKTIKVTVEIDLSDESDTIKVKSNLPGDGNAGVIAIQLKNLSDGLLDAIQKKVDRAYPSSSKEEKMEVIKTLTIKDLAK